MAYVPPHLRNKINATAPAKQRDSSPDQHSPAEIRNHFWPTPEPGGEACADSKTLHASAASPDSLAYVLLFEGANPQWPTHHIIFTKTSLDLLPTHLIDPPDGDSQADNSQRRDSMARVDPPTVSELASEAQAIQPIAVFEQVRLQAKKGRSFTFAGWFRVQRVALLEPGSPALVRMLEQKWTKKDRYGNPVPIKRDTAGWKASLAHRWAVVKMIKDEVAEKERGKPVIERLESEEGDAGGGKSVNEMLAAMRMGGSERGKGTMVANAEDGAEDVQGTNGSKDGDADSQTATPG